MRYSLEELHIVDAAREAEDWLPEHEEEDDESNLDDYGNPLDGSSLPYCAFPDCGCHGSRLCMAEKGFGVCKKWRNKQ